MPAEMVAAVTVFRYHDVRSEFCAPLGIHMGNFKETDIVFLAKGDIPMEFLEGETVSASVFFNIHKLDVHSFLADSRVKGRRKCGEEECVLSVLCHIFESFIYCIGNVSSHVS